MSAEIASKLRLLIDELRAEAVAHDRLGSTGASIAYAQRTCALRLETLIREQEEE